MDCRVPTEHYHHHKSIALSSECPERPGKMLVETEASSLSSPTPMQPVTLSSSQRKSRTGSPPVCTHCTSIKSPLWRRGVHNELLCNACGLYWKHHGTYRPLALQATTATTAESDARVAVRRPSHSRRALTVSHQPASTHQYGSSREEKQEPDRIKLPILRSKPTRTKDLPCIPIQAIFAQGATNLDLLASSRKLDAHHIIQQPRLILRPADIRDSNGHIISQYDTKNTRSELELRFIMHRGRMVFPGDHVIVHGDDGRCYFALIRDFWLSQDGSRFFTLRWLLPRAGSEAILVGRGESAMPPTAFRLGPEHVRPESMDSIVDVFYSPHGMCEDLKRMAGQISPKSTMYQGVSESPSKEKVNPILSQPSEPTPENVLVERWNFPSPVYDLAEDAEIAHVLCNLA